MPRKAARAAPVSVTVQNNTTRVRAAPRRRRNGPRLNPYLASLLNPFHVQSKMPDIVTSPSTTFYQFQSFPLTTYLLSGNSAFTFDPCTLNVSTSKSFLTINPAISAPGVITWGTGAACPGYAALLNTFTMVRLISAGVIFIPSAAVIAAPCNITVALVPSTSSTGWQSTYVPNVSTLTQSYGAQQFSSNMSWQCNYRPLDADAVQYQNPTVTAVRDNAICVTMTGGPTGTATTFGTIYVIANYEGLPGANAGGFIAPTPSPARSQWIEDAMNYLGNVETPISGVSFYGSPNVEGIASGGGTSVLPQMSTPPPSMMSSLQAAGGSAFSGFADTLNYGVSRAADAASAVAYSAGSAAAMLAAGTALEALRRHVVPRIAGRA